MTITQGRYGSLWMLLLVLPLGCASATRDDRIISAHDVTHPSESGDKPAAQRVAQTPPDSSSISHSPMTAPPSLPLPDGIVSAEYSGPEESADAPQHAYDNGATAAQGDSGRIARNSDAVVIETAMHRADERELTLDDLEQLAFANNPTIQQASAAASEAAGIRTQVGLYPNPSVGYSGTQIGDAGTDQHGAVLSQTIVLGDKLRWNQHVLDQDVQSLLWDVEIQRYRILTDVRQRFYDALAAQQRLELAAAFQKIAQKGVEIAQQRVEALEGSRPDVLQSEIQFTEVDLITQQARIDYDAARGELAAVVGIPNLPPGQLTGSLEEIAEARDLETTYQQLLSASPELQSARARIQSARANLQRQQLQPIPNLDAQVGAGHDYGTGDEYVNVQVELALPVFNRNEGNIQAAYAEYCRATHDARRLELNLRSRLARVMREYATAQVRVDRYRNQILPKTDENLSLSEEAHLAGEFDFLRVLVARRAFFEANVTYVEALADLAKADAAVEGLLLSGGLTGVSDFTGDDALRGLTLGQQ